MENNFQTRHKHKSLVIASENIQNKLQELKDKMENPFWIPRKNSDLFLVKKIYKDDKKTQKAISLSRTNRPHSKLKVPIDNLSMNNLKNFTNTYLTEQAKMNSTTETKHDSHNNTFGSMHPTKILENLKSKGVPVSGSPKANKNVVLNKKIVSIEAPKMESIKDYVDKTRQLLLMNYSMKIKEERIIMMEESYRNEIESIKDSIISMKKAKSKFEDEFVRKFYLYSKFLAVEKEKEKKVLNFKLEEKSWHDADIKQYENKIIKLKDKIELLSDYKLFLICIKEKKLFFLKNMKKPINSINPSSTGDSLSTNNNNLRESLYLTASSQNHKINPHLKKKNYKKHKTIMIQDYNHIENEEEDIVKIISNYDHGKLKVFEKQEELVNELKRMEAKNIELLFESNEIEQAVAERMKDTKNLEKEDKSSNIYISKEIKKKEDELKDIKDKNSRLKEEKDKLEKNRYQLNSTSSNSMTKNKLYKTQLFSKVMVLFKKCSELDIFDKDNGDKHKKLCLSNENQLEMMRLPEKTFQYVHDKYIEFGKSYPDDLKKFEKDLEAERKKQIALELTKEDEKKTEKLMQKLAEKYNKVIIKPTRKIADRVRPEEKILKDKIDLKNENEPNLMELLHYEGDDDKF